MKKPSPCHHCTRRTYDCHPKCPDYKGWDDERKQEKNAIFKAQQAERMTDGYERRQRNVQRRKALYKCYKG